MKNIDSPVFRLYEGLYSTTVECVIPISVVDLLDARHNFHMHLGPFLKEKLLAHLTEGKTVRGSVDRVRSTEEDVVRGTDYTELDAFLAKYTVTDTVNMDGTGNGQISALVYSSSTGTVESFTRVTDHPVLTKGVEHYQATMIATLSSGYVVKLWFLYTTGEDQFSIAPDIVHAPTPPRPAAHSSDPAYPVAVIAHLILEQRSDVS